MEHIKIFLTGLLPIALLCAGFGILSLLPNDIIIILMKVFFTGAIVVCVGGLAYSLGMLLRNE